MCICEYVCMYVCIYIYIYIYTYISGVADERASGGARHPQEAVCFTIRVDTFNVRICL